LHPADRRTLERLRFLLELAGSLPFRAALWETQNTLYASLIKLHSEWQLETEKGNLDAHSWLSTLTAASEKLGMKLA
jgi:hypothetical protein